MKKFLCTGKSVFKFTTNKPFTNIDHNLKYYSFMGANAFPTGRFKIESEQKSLREKILPVIINSREIKTGEDWKAIRNELFKAARSITPINIDSAIFGFCMGQRDYKLAYSYMEFLKEENVKPNLATIGKYFKLFYYMNYDKVVVKSEELKILALYKDLRKTYKLLDATTCENVIHALSLTENWRECLKLLEEIKISADPTPSVYSVVSASAFKNNENDLAWKLLNDIVEKGREPSAIVFLSYLQLFENASSKDSCLKGTEKLFEFFKYNDLNCNDEVANKIISVYKTLQTNCKTVIIDKKGICQNCKQRLQQFELSEEAFKNLKDAIFKNVIVGKNVFCRTTPDELEKFQKFIGNMREYDVVIDGLNVAYSAGVKQSPQVLSGLVASVVKHFVNKGKKILVLGRTHMRKWSGKNWSYITQHADTFLAQTLSQDDPFLLYCALNSGLNTIIVSRDLMRGHLFKLPDTQLKILFNQWLTQNQYQLQYVNNKGVVFFKYPLPYLRTAQKQGNCWHIPYGEKEAAENKWLCLSS